MGCDDEKMGGKGDHQGRTLNYGELHFDTNAVHAGQEPDRWTSRALVPPISLATTFKQREPAEPIQFRYSRSGNPTRRCLEDCLAALEHAKYALTYASGMAAAHNMTHLLNVGDHVVSFEDIFGGTDRLFRNFLIPRGFEVTFVDATDLSKIEAALKPNTKLVWLETPSNPTMKVVDIRGVCEVVRKKCKAMVAVDNTFMSSYFQKPLLLGADVSVHSLTKYANGHSDVIMGAICTNDKEIADRLRFLQNAAGAVPSPFDCYLVNRGLKTLHVRMERHMENGLKVAKFLEAHPLVEKVVHPGLPSHPQHEVAKRQCSGFSGMLTFQVKGGLSETTLFLKNLKVITLGDSLGSMHSLVEQPAVMTHAAVPQEERMRLGIADNLIRLSVGIESADDLINDIDHALKMAGSTPLEHERNYDVQKHNQFMQYRQGV